MTDMKKVLLVVFMVLAFCASSDARKTDRYVIGFYNLENLFDTEDDPAINDEDFLPQGRNRWTDEIYAEKLDNMAKVIAKMAKANKTFHSVLGVCEVENEKVLQDLAAHPLLAGAGYEIVHHDSPDRRGIDVAFLYRPEHFSLNYIEVIPYTFEGSSIDFVISKEEQAEFRTRDVLMMHGTFEGEHFAFYVAHLPSRAGDKPGSNQLRDRGAEIIYEHSQKMMKEYPGIKIICMGDMNDNPTDPSMADYMRGKEQPEEVGASDYFSPYISMLKAGYGTLSYRGVWNIYDLQLVNSALLNAPDGGLRLTPDRKGYYGNVYKRPFITNRRGKYKGTPFRSLAGGEFIGGYSDHYPTYIVLSK